MNFCIGVIITAVFIIIMAFIIKEPTWRESEEQHKLYTIKCIIAFIIAAIIFLCGVGLSFYSFCLPWEKPELKSVEHIVALSNDNDINGRFYLRGGHIEEKPYYYYMVKLNDGGYVMNKVPAMHDTTTIYYTEDNFKVEWYEQKQGFGLDRQSRTLWKIYIPAGSIQEDFSISLGK